MDGVPAESDSRPLSRVPLHAIVTCVGRAEHLRQTLAHNAALARRLTVVTHADDRETIEVVRSCPAAVLVLSDSCYAENHAFNKGRMINAALRQMSKSEWILLTDADVMLPGNLPGLLPSLELERDKIYGASRVETNGPALAADAEPTLIGYFLLFHPDAPVWAGRWPELMCEEFCSAGGVDTWLVQQYSPSQRVVVSELSVVHLSHASRLGADWNGPPRGGQWRQFGMLAPQGLLITEAFPVTPSGERRIRLVDTLLGLVWEGTVSDGQLLPAAVVHAVSGGLVWLGRPLGTHYIHCAYWRE